MTKFGELIDVNAPVLLVFFNNQDETSNSMHSIINDVASSLGTNVKVIKIDVHKNLELSEALRIKEQPTLIIYKSGLMKWRQVGMEDAKTLINRLKDYF